MSTNSSSAQSDQEPIAPRQFPPENPGYIRLQWPVTRARRLRRIDEATWWAIVGAISGAYIEVAIARQGETPEQHEATLEWLRQHPPLGFPRPRWHWQAPVVRVPAGVRLIGPADQGHAEQVLAGAAVRVLDEAADR